MYLLICAVNTYLYDISMECKVYMNSSSPSYQYIPDKIRNATRRTDQLSGRSQVMGQFRLYRCKGMSVTAALHIV